MGVISKLKTTLFGTVKPERPLRQPKKTQERNHRLMYVVIHENESTQDFWSRKNALEYAKKESKKENIEVCEVNAHHYDLNVGDTPSRRQFGIYRVWKFPQQRKSRM